MCNLFTNHSSVLNIIGLHVFGKKNHHIILSFSDHTGILSYMSIFPVRSYQWRSQGLPGWATHPPGGPKWGRKWVKVWGKIRKLNRDLRKKWGKWNSCPPGTVRLAKALGVIQWPHQPGWDIQKCAQICLSCSSSYPVWSVNTSMIISLILLETAMIYLGWRWLIKIVRAAH